MRCFQVRRWRISRLGSWLIGELVWGLMDRKIIKHFSGQRSLLDLFSGLAKSIASIKGISVFQSPARKFKIDIVRPRITPILQHYQRGTEAYTLFWRCEWKECFETAISASDGVEDGFVALDFPTMRFYGIIAATRMLLDNALIERDAISSAIIAKTRKVVPIGTSLEDLAPHTIVIRKQGLAKDRVKQLRRYVKAGRKHFKFLAKMCPQNHGHHVTFIDAELCNISGGMTGGEDASELYQMAAKQAQASGFNHLAALAFDFLSLYYGQILDSQNEQSFYLRSKVLYDTWKFGRL
jgi:hypothetical protein